MIHIQGMGVLGSLLALRLEHEGIRFTWNDTDAEHTAWRACTGAVYPNGAPGSIDDIAYNAWHAQFSKPTWAKFAVNRHMEASTYVFNHQRPPHGGRYAFEQLANAGLRFAVGLPSFHLNAQTLVPAIRKRFAAQRNDQADHRASGRVIAHGFGVRRSHAYWGWTRLVRLSYPKRFDPNGRPAFYFRQGRFVMAYAYPVPGTPFWYAGSSLIKQRVLRPLSMEPKYDRWKEFFTELSGGVVKVREAGDFIQGWRPAEEEPLVRHDKRRREITMPSLWNSGVRHAPYYIDQVVEEIRHANYR